MELGLKGKKALVTGAGRGIGRSIASCLAKEGASVAVVSRTAREINSLVTEMGGTAKGHTGLTMDLSPEGAPGKLVNKLGKVGFEAIDIIVHNIGGTLEIRDPFCSIEDWRNVWRFNLEIDIELNNLLVPGMQKRHWGRIVHISSISAMENHGPVTYCAVKAALTAYSRSMGRFLAPDGIIMTAVLPGAVMTEGGYWDITSKDRPEHVKKYLDDRMAIHRFGNPDEIGNIVAFLCSEQASFCVGSVVPVDGGQGRGYFGL
jgi:NAD(P)-dependent dehydrogenase (short-subunit alcohol dehydrogenase family)